MTLKKLMWALFAFLILSLSGCKNPQSQQRTPLIVPPHVPIPSSLLIDCAVPVIPASVDVSKLVDILTDSLSSIEGCNYRIGLIRQAEADRELQYLKLTKSAHQ